jgi:TrmH family RNA methyltransferase
MTTPSNDNIRIVLVETSHPGNIGAVARAMKNMELRALTLVRPRQFPHPDATARASGADDLLAQARVVDSVAAAVADCGWVIATTSRERDRNTPVFEVRSAAVQIATKSVLGPVAVLFGNERAGLANDEIAQAHALLRIPTGAAYASLNLAMAVQIVSYEVFRARGGKYRAPPAEVPLATGEQIAQLFSHWEQVMNEVDFKDRTRSGQHLMARVRRFLLRAELDQNEANILRGFLTAIQHKRRPAGSRSDS